MKTDKSYKELLADITTLLFDVDGVLTNGIVTVYPDGQLLRQMNTKDGYALKRAVDAGLNVCIISGGRNKGVKKRLQDLGVQDIYLGASNKIVQYNELKEKYKFSPKNVLYMGDDIPDLEVMKQVGLPCCPNDATQEVQNEAMYISNKKGGEGAVRDIVEQILKVKGKWNEN